MVYIFAPGGYELATKSMIPGNGINLLDGTKDASNFSVANNNGNVQSKDEIPNIKDSVSTAVIHIWGNSQKNAKFKYDKDLNLVPGFYTLSFVGAGNDSSNSIKPIFNVYDDSEILGVGNTPILYSTTFVSITFKVSSIKPINLIIGSDSSDSYPGSSIWIGNLKLEAGMNATPWSESPNDKIQELKSELQAK